MDGSCGDSLVKMFQGALKSVGVIEWFHSVVGACVDGAELRKLR